MSLRPPTRAEERKKSYKIGVYADDARRRREDNLVEIRKSKREDNLLKKRRDGGTVAREPQLLDLLGQAEQKLKIPEEMGQGLWSDDPIKQLQATTQLRKLLSCEMSLLYDKVIEAGVVPQVVEFLSRTDLPQLQIEAAWALANVAAGTSKHTQNVIDQGAIPKFVELLSSPNDSVREQAVWALGNIAGDSPRCRDLVLGHGALMPLLAQLNEHSRISMLRNATWTLSNLCRGKPPPSFKQTKLALQKLKHLIYSLDEEVVTNSCWALSSLSDGNSIQAVIEADVCPRLVELLLHPSLTVVVAALCTVGNVVCGNDTQVQIVVDRKLLPCLLHLLTRNYKKSVIKEACWTISNITAGNKTQIQAVIDSNVIAPLVSLLQNAEYEIKEEAAWAISNATSGGSDEQIRYLVSQGCIRPLCDLLLCSDPRIVKVCLKALDKILEAGEADKESRKTNGANVYAQMIYDCEGLDKIESLLGHNNGDIFELAIEMLDGYWAQLEEDENEDEEKLHCAYNTTLQV